MKKTIVELDLRGYSAAVTVLEEHFSPEIVSQLNEQIQGLVNAALAALGIVRKDVEMKTQGDNAILCFDLAETAHRFGVAVHQACRVHNHGKTIPTAIRWFRIGMATGEVPASRTTCVTLIRSCRLEAAAGVGEILADEATYQALPAFIQAEYGPREIIHDKNHERFEVYRCAVVRAAAAPAGGARSIRPAGPAAQGHLDLARAKREALQEALILATDVAVKFKLKSEIQELDRLLAE